MSERICTRCNTIKHTDYFIKADPSVYSVICNECDEKYPKGVVEYKGQLYRPTKYAVNIVGQLHKSVHAINFLMEMLESDDHRNEFWEIYNADEL